MAATYTNYTGVYIIMDCLQGLANNLLVWQSNCKSKLHPLKANLLVQLYVNAELVIGTLIRGWHIN